MSRACTPVFTACARVSRVCTRVLRVCALVFRVCPTTHTHTRMHTHTYSLTQWSEVALTLGAAGTDGGAAAAAARLACSMRPCAVTDRYGEGGTQSSLRGLVLRLVGLCCAVQKTETFRSRSILVQETEILRSRSTQSLYVSELEILRSRSTLCCAPARVTQSNVWQAGMQSYAQTSGPEEARCSGRGDG
jgi:hypothetical protein